MKRHICPICGVRLYGPVADGIRGERNFAWISHATKSKRHAVAVYRLARDEKPSPVFRADIPA